MSVFGGTKVPVKYQAQVLASAAKWGVPPAFLAAQLDAESGFNPSAVSPDGAIGIAQFMPGTAKSVGLNPHDANASIDAMAKLMAHYHKQYGTWEKALYAYHDGPGKVEGPGPAGRAYAKKILGRVGTLLGSSAGVVADTADAAITPVSLTSTTKALGKLNDPVFWNRVGMYVLGIGLVIAGLLFLFRQQATDVASQVVKGSKGAV